MNVDSGSFRKNVSEITYFVSSGMQNLNSVYGNGYSWHINCILMHIVKLSIGTLCCKLWKNGLTDQDAFCGGELGGSTKRITCVDAPMGRGTFGVSGQLKSIVKHRIWGLGNRVSCAKNIWTDLDDLYIA